MTETERNDIRIEKIKEIRRRNGMTQKDFANKIGMNISYFCRVEKGATLVTDTTLKKISEEFGIPLTNLLDDSMSINQEETKIVRDSGRSGLVNNAHITLDEIISYGGKDNLMYMRDLNQLLVEIQYLLEYKNQFEDLSEKEEDVIEKGQHLIEIIMGMS